jgi:hypothetical protein
MQLFSKVLTTATGYRQQGPRIIADSEIGPITLLGTPERTVDDGSPEIRAGECCFPGCYSFQVALGNSVHNLSFRHLIRRKSSDPTPSKEPLSASSLNTTKNFLGSIKCTSLAGTRVIKSRAS